MSGQLQYMDLPVTTNAYKDTTDGQDYYMMVLDKDASALIYASYIGSPFRGDHVDGGTSRFDKRGIMHQAVCAGCGADDNFPTTPGAWSNTNNSTNCNTGTFQFDFEFPTLNTEFSMDHTSGCYPLDVNFASQTSISDSISVDFFWDFGDGSSDTLANPTHQYSEPGQYEASLIISDPNTCNIRDTLTKTIRVITDSARQISDISICQGGSAQIGVLPDIDSSATYQWIPGSELSDEEIANPIAFPDSTMAYRLLISSGSCTDTLHQKVFVLNGESDSLPTQEICIYDTIQIGIINTNNFNFHWEPDYMISDTGMALTIAYPDTTTNYRLIVQNQFCGDTLKQKIKVKYPVVWGFDQDTSICRGQNIQIGMPDTFGVDYEWAPSLYLNNNSFSRPISIPDSSISYTLLSNQEACRLADSISITVLDVPSLSISSDENICYGDSVQLNAIGDLGYIWLPDTNISETNISSPTAYPITTTFYSVSTWNIYNCYVKDSIKISVAPPLSVEIGEQDSICFGDSYQLNASITEPGSPGSPAPYAYSWSPVTYLNYTNLSNPVSTPGESIKYYLDVTDGQLCEATDSIFIYISPVAPDSLAKDTSICINDSILIGFTDTLTALNYQWHPNTGIINDSASLTWASPQTSTNYILTPDDTLCQKPDSIFIEVFVCFFFFLSYIIYPILKDFLDLFFALFTAKSLLFFFFFEESTANLSGSNVTVEFLFGL
ncbi:MAG TPA: PKD domain-containing protein [Bacteroidetes bacterium]|nr:PKD domain-containing protein [Bacteroidota bacterium]